jgi:periplasmic divalent cation tolerance protein
MPVHAPQARIVLTSLNGHDEAIRLGQTLVEEKLAACATIFPGAQSIYRWQGQIESVHETILLLKTCLDHIPALEVRLHELHGYQTPEFIVLPIEAGSKAYLEWLQASVQLP